MRTKLILLVLVITMLLSSPIEATVARFGANALADPAGKHAGDVLKLISDNGQKMEWGTPTGGTGGGSTCFTETPLHGDGTSGDPVGLGMGAGLYDMMPGLAVGWTETGGGTDKIKLNAPADVTAGDINLDWFSSLTIPSLIFNAGYFLQIVPSDANNAALQIVPLTSISTLIEDRFVLTSMEDTTASTLMGEIIEGTGISITQTTGGDRKLVIGTTVTQYTDEMAEDAVGGCFYNTGHNVAATYDDANAHMYWDFTELDPLSLHLPAPLPDLTSLVTVTSAGVTGISPIVTDTNTDTVIYDFGQVAGVTLTSSYQLVGTVRAVVASGTAIYSGITITSWTVNLPGAVDTVTVALYVDGGVTDSWTTTGNSLGAIGCYGAAVSEAITQATSTASHSVSIYAKLTANGATDVIKVADPILNVRIL